MPVACVPLLTSKEESGFRDPNRSLLGKAQLARFTAGVKKSTAKWKVMNAK
jgi:phosphodiesterase/alkaline phosphatase D-like protein